MWTLLRGRRGNRAVAVAAPFSSAATRAGVNTSSVGCSDRRAVGANARTGPLCDTACQDATRRRLEHGGDDHAKYQAAGDLRHADRRCLWLDETRRRAVRVRSGRTAGELERRVTFLHGSPADATPAGIVAEFVRGDDAEKEIERPTKRPAKIPNGRRKSHITFWGRRCRFFQR